MSGFKKLLFGEKMPDKNDPRYKDRYDKEVDAGRRFAQKIRIDKAAFKVQNFANSHRKIFLAMVFGFIAICLSLNIYRMVLVANHKPSGVTATQYQEELLRKRHEQIRNKVSHKNQTIKQESDGNTTEN